MDTPITFGLFTNLKSAIVMIECNHVMKHSRHIDRRVHFVKQARMQGMFQVFKVPGEINPADVGTKNLSGTEIKNHTNDTCQSDTLKKSKRSKGSVRT